MADQEKQSLLEALEVKRQQREQESQAQERMLGQLKAGNRRPFQLSTGKLQGQVCRLEDMAGQILSLYA